MGCLLDVETRQHLFLEIFKCLSWPAVVLQCLELPKDTDERMWGCWGHDLLRLTLHI